MKIGILTFHGAHNYGSMLQNYALQQAIKQLDGSLQPVTINLRNKAQDDMYNIFKPFREFQDKRRYLFKIIMSPWRKQLERKQQLFEEFLSENISLTPLVRTGNEIPDIDDITTYITGSDQIWNFTAHDFDWSYLLDFVADDSDIKRISYAPSMGPKPSIDTLSADEKKKAEKLLKKFTAISVRESKTADVIKELGKLNCLPLVLPDPTLLLTAETWADIARKPAGLKAEKYIFLYNPYFLPEVYEQAKEASRITGLKVITSTLAPKTILPSKDFMKILEVGPREFLYLVKNAEYVIGRSFHVAVFAMIFQKKFIAVEGMNDSRLGNFLKEINMERCATLQGNVKVVLKNLDSENPPIHACMDRLRESGIKFLRENLL